jgi:hypothetical protein
MTHDELLAKAIEWLRKWESRLPERVRDVTVDRLPKRRIRDAVVIDFESDDNRGKIRITLDRDTGEMLGASHAPPTKKSDDHAA